ncbi:JAB domain-containing protein [Cytobacillus firmus]|uniref:JAB domain-containing protein n=1 Tax=Cytobacillus firmus TaxID=1399 RepID=UPI0036B7DA9B
MRVVTASLVLPLNTNQNVIAVHRCHIGSLDRALISPREVFKACILNNARRIIVALDIPLQDHIIINTEGNYLSFREEGFISRGRLIIKNDAKLNMILHK